MLTFSDFQALLLKLVAKRFTPPLLSLVVLLLLQPLSIKCQVSGQGLQGVAK